MFSPPHYNIDQSFGREFFSPLNSDNPPKYIYHIVSSHLELIHLALSNPDLSFILSSFLFSALPFSLHSFFSLYLHPFSVTRICIIWYPKCVVFSLFVILFKYSALVREGKWEVKFRCFEKPNLFLFPFLLCSQGKRWIGPAARAVCAFFATPSASSAGRKINEAPAGRLRPGKGPATISLWRQPPFCLRQVPSSPHPQEKGAGWYWEPRAKAPLTPGGRKGA